LSPAEYQAYQQEFERCTQGLTYLTTGNSCECESCSDGGEDEGHFSRYPCDTCGSRLAGQRHSAHAQAEPFGLVHLEVCEECLYYINYGRLDDQTMDEINHASKSNTLEKPAES